MKYGRHVVVVCFLCCVWLNGMAATREGEGAQKFQSDRERLSVLLLLEEQESRFAVGNFPDGEAAMVQAMRAAPERYCQLETARRAMRTVFDKALRSAYRKEAERIVRPFAAKLSAAESRRLLAGDRRFFEERIQSLYGSAFTRVRERLAREQRQKISRELRPTAAELEQYRDAQLLKLLTARFQKESRQPWWEENAELLKRELIAPAIAEGRRQQSMQLLLARRMGIPAEMWTAPEAEKYLLNEIPVVMRQKRAGRFCYPLFAATRRAAAKRAAELPVERAAAALPHQLPGALYRDMVTQNTVGHRDWQQSLQLALPELTGALITSALNACDPPAAFREKLVRDPRLRLAAERRVRALQHELQIVRDEIARRQLENAWPELVGGKWLPQPGEVETYAASGSRELPPLSGQPKTADWLRETELVMEKAVRNALALEVARLEKQRQTVETLYEEVLTTMTALQQTKRERAGNWLTVLFAGGKHVTLPEIVRYYRAETEKRSSAPLFPAIEREIEVRARAMLPKVRSPEPEKKPKPQPPAEKTKKKIVLTLRLAGDGDRLRLTLDGWQKEFAPQHCPKEELKRELRARLASEKGPFSCQIRLLVKGGRIYYSTVSELRNFLKDSLAGAAVEDALQK